MDDWVFVDTCIWSSFFKNSSSEEKTEVDNLIDRDRVALIGPIVGEVLLGFKRTDQANWVASRLRLVNWTDILWEDWRRAADLGRELAGNGHRLPLTDLVLAAIAERTQAWLYSTDPHFDLLPNLKRYKPGE